MSVRRYTPPNLLPHYLDKFSTSELRGKLLLPQKYPCNEFATWPGLYFVVKNYSVMSIILPSQLVALHPELVLFNAQEK